MTKSNHSLKLKIKDTLVFQYVHFAYTVVRVRFKLLTGRHMVRWHRIDGSLIMQPEKIWNLVMFDRNLRRKGRLIEGAKYRAGP